MLLHENENYFVRTALESEKNYEVVNKETEKIEYFHNYLPQVIGVAEQFNFLLVNKVWKEFSVDEKAELIPFNPKLN